MKKFVAMLLALVLAVSMLAACSGGSGEDGTTTAPASHRHGRA